MVERSNVKNAADVKQVKKAGDVEKNRRRQELLDIKSVMETESGRRLIWRIVNVICHVDSQSSEHSGSQTYFNEGERNIGRILKSDVYEAAFDEYQKMERECVMARVDAQLEKGD